MTVLMEELGQRKNDKRGRPADELSPSKSGKRMNGKSNKGKKQKKGDKSFEPVCVYDDPANKKNSFFEVEKIVGVRNKSGRVFYKVRWRGCDRTKDTWEPSENLCDSAFDAMIQQQKKEFEKGSKCDNIEYDSKDEENCSFFEREEHHGADIHAKKIEEESDDDKKIDALLAMLDYDDMEEGDDVGDGESNGDDDGDGDGDCEEDGEEEDNSKQDGDKECHKNSCNDGDKDRDNDNDNDNEVEPTTPDDPWNWTDDEQVKFREIQRIQVHDADARERVTDARLSGTPVILIGHSGWPQFASRWLEETPTTTNNMDMDMEQKQEKHQKFSSKDPVTERDRQDTTDELLPTSTHPSPMTVTPTSATSATSSESLAAPMPTAPMPTAPMPTAPMPTAPTPVAPIESAVSIELTATDTNVTTGEASITTATGTTGATGATTTGDTTTTKKVTTATSMEGAATETVLPIPTVTLAAPKTQILAPTPAPTPTLVAITKKPIARKPTAQKPIAVKPTPKKMEGPALQPVLTTAQSTVTSIVPSETTSSRSLLDLSKPHELCIDRMIADIGHESVPVIRRNYNERNPIHTEITASAFMKRCWSSFTEVADKKKNNKAKKSELLYLHQWQFPLSETASRILCGEDKTIPLPNNILGEDLLKYWLDSDTCNGDSPFQYIFMGGEGTMSKLHKDAGGLEISIAPIIGQKEVVLVHRSDGIGCLYHLDANIDKINLHTYPMLSQARIWHSILNPGEILLMPQGTYHQARNVTPCLSYSRFHLDTVNLKPFLDSLLDGDAPEIQHDYVIWNSTTELRDRIDTFSELVRKEAMDQKKNKKKITKKQDGIISHKSDDHDPSMLLSDDIIRTVDTLRQLRNICRELAGRLRVDMEKNISGGSNIKSGIQQSMPDSDDRDPVVWDKIVDDVDETLHDFRYRCAIPRPTFKKRRGEFKKKRKRTNESLPVSSTEPITGVVSIKSKNAGSNNDYDINGGNSSNPFISIGVKSKAGKFSRLSGSSILESKPRNTKIKKNGNGGTSTTSSKASSSSNGDDKLNNAVNSTLPNLHPDEIGLAVSDFIRLNVGDSVSIKFHGKRVDYNACNCKIVEIVDMMRAAYLSYEDYSSCYHDEYQPIEQLRIPLPGEGVSSLPEVRPEDLKQGLVVIDRVWGNQIEDYRAVVQMWKVATFYRVQFQVNTPGSSSKFLILQRWITRDCILQKKDRTKKKMKATGNPSSSNNDNLNVDGDNDNDNDDNSTDSNRNNNNDEEESFTRNSGNIGNGTKGRCVVEVLDE